MDPMNQHLPQIDIHIGTHKTGTTTIQHWLVANQEPLLRHGTLYPTSGRPLNAPDAQHRLAWAIREKSEFNHSDAWTEFFDELQRTQPQRVIISAEGFDGCKEREIELLSNLLHSYSVRVIVYFRNPLGFLKSAFKQQVKMGTWKSPPKAFLMENVERCNYPQIIQRWQQWIGRENMVVRLFDKVVKTSDIITDFATAALIDARDFQQVDTANESPSNPVIGTLLRLNQVQQRLPRSRVVDYLFSRLRGNVQRGSAVGKWICRIPNRQLTENIFSRNEIAMVRDKSAEWNDALFGQYLADEDRKYFEIRLD